MAHYSFGGWKNSPAVWAATSGLVRIISATNPAATSTDQNGRGTIMNRIAGAAISWAVCEVPGWGYQLGPQKVLTDARDWPGRN
jgi:hypothetical protein